DRQTDPPHRLAEHFAGICSKSHRTDPGRRWPRHDVGGRICRCWCCAAGDNECGADSEDEVLNMNFPLADRTYRHLFIAQVIALAGTGLSTIALSLLAYDIAGSNAGAVL